MYLSLRGNTWHFSRRLPNDSSIRAGAVLILPDRSIRIGKNGYIRFSLETSDKKEAHRLSRHYAAEVDKAIEAQAKRTTTADEPITDRDIKTAAMLMQSSLLAADEAQHKEALVDLLTGQEVGRAPDREHAQELSLPPATVAGDAKLLELLRAMIPFYLLQATGKTISGNLSEYSDRLLPFTRAWRETVTALQKRAEGKLIPTPADPRQDPTEGARLGWDELLSYYEEQHPNLAQRTIALYRLAIGELSDFARCDPIDLTRAKVVSWRDDLLKRLHSKTALTRLIAAGTVFRYALHNEKFGERSNPFNSVTVAGAKSAPSSRKGFEGDSLKKVFKHFPALSDIPASSGGHAAYWIPVIALFTGARRGEVAGLLLEDIGQDSRGVWYFHFRDNALRPLKTGVSERMVPLHKELIRLGFPKYIQAARQAGVDRLFPGIADVNTVGEWFSEYVRKQLGELEFKQDLHSLRHTFKTASRDAALTQEIHDALTGHATPGVGAKYGNRAALATLKREIDKVEYRGLGLKAPPVPTKLELNEQEAGRKRRLCSAQQRKVKIEARKAAPPRRGRAKRAV